MSVETRVLSIDLRRCWFETCSSPFFCLRWWSVKKSITLGHSLADACDWNSVCCRNGTSIGRSSRIISDYAMEKFVSAPPHLQSEQLRWLRMWRMTQIKSARSEQPFRTSQTLETDSNRICNAKWESEQTLLITNEVRDFFLSSSPRLPE